jgi:C-terminal peptidase prc
MKASDVPPLLQGDEGTSVKIAIERKTGKKIEALEKSVTRRRIAIPNVSGTYFGPPGEGILSIRINSFMDGNTCQGVANVLAEQGRRGLRGIILDLRDNGGGLTAQGACIVGLFKGPRKRVATTRTVDGQRETGVLESGDRVPQLVPDQVPTVVLVNGHSASASEIVTGALQDYAISGGLPTLIVGERTFGKGTQQRLVSGDAVILPAIALADSLSQGMIHAFLTPERLASLKAGLSKFTYALTLERFYLPSGRSNQIVGIQPDIEVFRTPDPTEDDKFTTREGDLYLNAVAAGEANPPTHSAVATKVNGCLAEIDSKQVADALEAKGAYTARRQWDLAGDDNLKPDYALERAKEVVICLGNL